jgi:superfamily II DNA helicase RecQ
MDSSINTITATPEGLFYYEEYQILLCLTCHAGIRPGDASGTHLRNVHQWKGEKLKAARSYISTLQLQDPHTVDLPPNGSTAIPELGTPVTGYSCRSCDYLTSSRKKLTEHLRQQRHSREGENWEKVKLQSFSHGRCARYWIVTEEEGQDDNHVNEHLDRADDANDGEWTAMLSRYDAALTKEHEERRRIAENPSGVENVSRWVQEMGWAKHFDGKDKTAIHLASLMPRAHKARRQGQHNPTLEEVDPQLTPLGDSFDRVIKRCSRRMELVPHETLRWLNSIDPNKPAGAPFTLKERDKSMYKYRQFGKRCLCYCGRMYRLGREEAEEQHGIRFNDVQWEKLEGIVDRLDVMADKESEEGEEGEVEEADEQTTALDQAVFEFWVAILKQKVAFKVYVNPLLHFAAVLGINDETGGWTQAKHFTASLAGLVWCGRVLMLEHIFDGQPEDPEEITIDMVEQFKGEYRQWMADGTHTPFSTMVRWMSYGKGFRNKESGLPTVIWEESGEAVRYLGQQIKIREFRDAVKAGVDEAEAVLDELMFGQWEEMEGSIEMDRIVDSLMYEGPDRSFATNEKNAWLQPGHHFLAQKSKGTLWKTGHGWQVKKVAAYLRRLKVFKLLQFANTHIWGGQPGRGPEMSTMRHCDTQQLIRNMFVFDGQVLIITDRDKSRAIRGLGRKVARFLPDKLGKMMVAYVTWVMPWEEMLHEVTKIPGPSKDLRSSMWKDGRKGMWETAQLSDSMASLTGRHMGVELMVSDYRHFAIVLGRKIKEIVIREVEVEMGEQQDGDDMLGVDPTTGERRHKIKMDYIWDLQATHGSAIARRHYALDGRFPNQLQPEMMANFREISRLWHRFLMGGDDKAERGVKRNWIESDDSNESTGKRTGKKARQGREVWKDGRGKETTEEATATADEIQNGLQKLIGSSAAWKTKEQGEAMERIMRMSGRESLIVILPTGGGKSVLFMLPGFIKGAGTSIVVVPFTALMDDLVDRARKSGMDCIRWKSGSREEGEQHRPAAKMVVVSADVASTQQFIEYADGLRAQGRLDRIFVDECHTIIMDVGYRRDLEALKGLHRYDCPVVLLTATLPPAMERWFRQCMLVTDASMIRARTTKRNIRYKVVRVEQRSKVQDEVVRVVLKMTATMQGDQKGVVYCRSKAGCEKLAEKLGCDYYHSGITDEQQRQHVLKQWVSGRGGNRWITATTGLGTGVDIPGVVGVVHMEQPYGLVDFVQQTGRGGRRAGEVVESVIVMDGQKARVKKQSSDMEHLNHQAMEGFVESLDCRRRTLGQFMDGEGGDCRVEQGELCDICGAKYDEVVEEDDGVEVVDEVEDSNSRQDGQEDEYEMEGSNGLKEYVRSKSEALIGMRRWLDSVADDCAVCYVKWHQHDCQERFRKKTRHDFRQCPVIRYDEYVGWRRQITFGDYGCCWGCGLPQGLCTGWESGECSDKDKVMPVVMMVERSGRLKRMVLEEFGIDAGDSDRYVEWIGRSRRMYSEDMTNGLAVWDLIIRQVCKSKDSRLEA